MAESGKKQGDRGSRPWGLQGKAPWPRDAKGKQEQIGEWNEPSEEEPWGPGSQLKEGGGGQMCPGR